MKPTITLSTQNDQVVIHWDHQVRLSGGAPIFEGITRTFGEMTRQNNQFTWQAAKGPVTVETRLNTGKNIISFFLSPNGNHSPEGEHFLGLFFATLPKYQQGVAIWRYKPWNSWTKPMKIAHPRELEAWDVQFFYWQYDDETYAAAMPLCGQGYRTTLGQENGWFGSKSVGHVDRLQRNDIPQLAIGFGSDPYQLFADLYAEGLAQMSKSENLRQKKVFPDVFESIGWCTWNASNLGRDLDETHVLNGVQTFADHNFQLGWVLIDDGWFDHTNTQLKALTPHPLKFPNGFRPMIDQLKTKFAIRDVGVWHALDGYWNGIHPDSELGKQYQNELFAWTQKERPDREDAPWRTYHFISTESDSLSGFYNRWHRYFKDQGFSMVKVDNQLVVERMCVDNYPLFDLAEKLHAAMNQSVMQHFDGALINCMDMTADAYFNFGSTAIARSVEDFFPYEPGETYNLQRGNAAAHVLQAIYNALYFGQMVYPDFDMFQSHHPQAEFHAIARALNCGPIYLTDIPGQQNFDILRRLVYTDGRIIRSDTPLLPVADCLFQVQDPRPFKAFSMAGATGLLGIWNCADAESVTGSFSPSDIPNLTGETFAVYEYFSRRLVFVTKDAVFPVTLPRLGYQLYYIMPLNQGCAMLGNLQKYNAPKTILQRGIENNKVTATILEGGTFAIAAQKTAQQVFVDEKEATFSYHEGLLWVEILLQPTVERKIEIRF